MNWAHDNAGLRDKDLADVFKYAEAQSTVVHIRASEKKGLLWTLQGKAEWDDWLSSECPTIDGSTSGLVLVLAKRAGEPSSAPASRAPPETWHNRRELPENRGAHAQRQHAFASRLEKSHPPGPSAEGALRSGQRSVRTLPFSRDTFQRLTRKFYTNSSIARVISRADIPFFSSAEVRMGGEDGQAHSALVYNCRTTNAWEMDLALTTTYFPHCGLTFAILFGCPLSVEEEMLKRLSRSMAESAHPLLMPGIFAELERSRHVQVIEATIDEVEARIFELDYQHSDVQDLPESETEMRNREKRSEWLDTKYLRNGLLSWNTQLGKMARHADELNKAVFRPAESEGAAQDPETENEYMRRISHKIEGRIQDIIDEYEDKIRDCAMRIDGMAMATQWAYEETNVQIARGTNRDSKVMKSIALVTMIFLPGTFFASVFSMTFFNWLNPDGGQVVSDHIWIYVVFAVSFTALTVGAWWYFVIYRSSRADRKRLSGEEIPLADFASDRSV